MAGNQLVGEAFLSDFNGVLLDRMTSPEVLNFFKVRKLNGRLLVKLVENMRSIDGALDDAEEKQINDSYVKDWLEDLKHVTYEADDLLDEIAYESLRSKMHGGYSLWKKENKEMEANLEEIVGRLEDLAKQKDVLGLKDSIREKSTLRRRYRISPPMVDDSIIYGRYCDKEAIMKLLLSEDAKLDVISIVGMGGMGKTTVAQLVYNDRRVRDWFDLKAWVFVSEESYIFKVIKGILMSLGSGNFDTMTPDHLQLELRRRLTGRKFLLVLDDVWDVSYADWYVLETTLKSAAQGSKLIFTTRDETVARVMATVPLYHLKPLSDEEHWHLFANHAFGNESSSPHPDLRCIGREIVRKCNGLPLAAIAVGGLLHSIRSVEEWEKICKSDLWDLQDNASLPALALSYHYLPSDLKRCFAYCAIFPWHYEFTKEEVVLLWMGEGFLIQSEGYKEMEEIGNQYFDDFVSRGLFFAANGDRSSFSMHDLVNDLAMSVSGQSCFSLDGNNSCKHAERACHLSYARTEHDAFNKFKGIHDAKHLRTFLPLGWSQWWRHKRIDNQVTHDLLPKLTRLRVLSLSQYRSVTDLPDSIGNLKHLRYLNLSATSIKTLPEIVGTLFHLQTLILHECRDLSELPNTIGNLKHLQCLNLHGTSIKRLPESMSSLYNLQTLLLDQCKDLVELPTDLRRLTNLCHLGIRGTKLQEMPAQMGKLRKLKKLTHFIVEKQSGSSLKEVGELPHLQGELCIWKLQNVVDASDALAANLKSKQHLKELEFRWNGNANESFHEKVVLERLQPHTNIECLSIIGYGSTTFPDWLGDSSFSNIVSLKLNRCKRCSSLPPLGQLAALRSLSITAFGEVVAIGPEFYGSCTSVPFRSLKILRFAEMPHWNEWISDVSAFPLLRELYIRECPNLRKALPSHLPSLTILKIEKCQQLVASLPRSSRLHSLMIDELLSLDSLPEQMGSFSTALEKVIITKWCLLKCFPLELFPKLSTFYICGCPNLQSVSALEESVGNFEYLNFFEIGDCPNFVSFPKGGLSAADLTVLRLRNCPNLRLLPERMYYLLPALVNLEIVDCPELESFPEAGLPSKLETLKIENCSRLIAGRMRWNLQSLPSLLHFQIVMSEEVESFPEKTLLPSTLVSLKIWDLQNLKSLDDEGLQCLTSLKNLEISDCPKLLSMPERRLPASLSCLSIWHCPSLEKRCQREKGEDWPKISHIPCVEIMTH